MPGVHSDFPQSYLTSVAAFRESHVTAAALADFFRPLQQFSTSQSPR